jgi:hypothetical protein
LPERSETGILMQIMRSNPLSRTRTKSSVPVVGTTNLQRRTRSNVSNPWGSWSTIATGNQTLSSQIDTCVDTLTPGFRAKLNKGEILNNACSISKSSVLAGGGSLFMSNTANTIEYRTTGNGSLTRFYLNRSGSPSGIQHPTSVLPSVVINNLKSEALGNVDRAPNSIAEDMLEVRETFRLLRDPLGNLRHLSDVFRGRTQDLISGRRYNRLRAMAETWASMRWGFAPLVNSVDTILGGLTGPSYHRKKGTLQVAYASTTGRGSVNQPSLKQSWSGGFNEYAHTETLEESARAYVIYRLNNPLNDWRQTFGLRAKDIPEALWAVVPWSFMVDRVLDVSARIRAISALTDPTIDILGGGVVVRSTRVETWKYLRQQDTGYSFSGGGDTEATITSSYVRTIWTPTVKDLIPSELEWKGLVSDTLTTADTMSAAMLIFTRGLNKRYQHGY